MNPAFQPPSDYTRREVDAAASPSCPWYGQSDAFAGRFVPREGNRCALITSAHSPCWMEVAEARAPDWTQCPRNPEFVTDVIRGLPAEQRFNAHVEYIDQLRVQRGIAEADSLVDYIKAGRLPIEYVSGATGRQAVFQRADVERLKRELDTPLVKQGALLIRGLPAEQRFNAHVEYIDQLRVQRGIAEAESRLTPPSSTAP